MTDTPRLVLASASPARLRTLRSAGVEPEVLVSGVDESTVESTDARVVCATLARMKAEAVTARLRADHPGPNSGSGAGRLVLGCDSVLEFDGQILGKPRDAADATFRWRQMRGAHGTLHTGHCLIDAGTGKAAQESAATTVHFADISDGEIAAYVGTGEPLQVAGAFTIDGVGGWFVERIDGDAGTVIGLSLPVLRRLLAQLGTGPAAFWPGPRTASPPSP